MSVTDVRPALLEPANVADLASAVARAATNRQSIAIQGAGTKLGWGSIAPPVDVTISTRMLNALVEHRFGDLTATVQAGAPLADVNRELSRHGQWIALDPPFGDRSTIGGIIATNDSGPRRHRFGAPRDQIIGVEVVRADGVKAKAGGIVVKNVAGYDLGRLMTGSFGSLAIVTAATFKLYPTPPASRTVVVEIDDRASTQPGRATAPAERVQAIVNALTSSQLTPTAIEFQTHPTRLLVRFESIEAAADQQVSQAADLARSNSAAAAIVADADEAALWATHGERPWRAEGAIVKVTLRPTEVGSTLAWLAESLSGVEWEAIGRAAAGVLLVRVGGDTGGQARAVTAIRARLTNGQGSAVVVRGSDELKRAIDVWGPPGDALPLMRAVKQQFDPMGLLNPGRGPFGI